MTYECFLYTRDEKVDYKWWKKSKMLSKEFKSFCKNIIALRGDIDLNLSKEDSEYLVVGFNYQNSYVILRILVKQAVDIGHRSIFSLEGLVIPNVTRRGILDIANAVCYLYGKEESLRTMYMNGNLNDTIEIASTINPLDGLENNEHMSYPSMLKKLVKDLVNADERFSFVYGRRAGEIWYKIGQQYHLQRCYDEGSMEEVRFENNKLSFIKNSLISDTEALVLCLKLQRKSKNDFVYTWMLNSQKNELIGQSGEQKFKMSISLNRLLDQKAIIDFYAACVGLYII